MSTCDEIFNCTTDIVIEPPPGTNSATNLGSSIMNVAAWAIAGLLGGPKGVAVNLLAAAAGEIQWFPDSEQFQPIGIHPDADLSSDASFFGLTYEFFDQLNNDSDRDVNRSLQDLNYAWGDLMHLLYGDDFALYGDEFDPDFLPIDLHNVDQETLYNILSRILSAENTSDIDINDTQYPYLQAQLVSTLLLEDVVSNKPFIAESLLDAVDWAHGSEEAQMLINLSSIDPVQLENLSPLLEKLADGENTEAFIQLARDATLLNLLSTEAGLSEEGSGGELYDRVLESPLLIEELSGSPVLSIMLNDLLSSEGVQSIIAEKLVNQALNIKEGTDLYGQHTDVSALPAGLRHLETGQTEVEIANPLQQMNTEIASHSSDLVDLRLKITALTARVAKNEGQITSLHARINELSGWDWREEVNRSPDGPGGEIE